MRNSRFFNAALSMVRILPVVAKETSFALKGGTAINLFVRDLPRLSVDIDLTYLPIESREESLNGIHAALSRISEGIIKSNPKNKVTKNVLRGTKLVFKLIVQDGRNQIKIEPNLILRGSAYPPIKRSLSKKAEELFEASTEIQTLHDADLYGGKLCAALDRQHPRDIFDIKLLLENEGITEQIRKAFIIYLASHSRPMHELLDPGLVDFRKSFEGEFEDMASEPISYEELLAVRKKYISAIRKDLTNKERQFLISLKSGAPDWKLIDISNAGSLPGIQWKLENIKKMTAKKREESLAKLKEVLKE